MYDKYFSKFKKFVDKTEAKTMASGRGVSLDTLFNEYFHHHMTPTDRSNMSIQRNNQGGYGLVYNFKAKPLPISVYTDKADTGVHSNPTHKQTITPINMPKQPKTTNNKPVIHTQPTPQMPSKHEKKPPTEDELLQKLVDKGLAVVHNKPPEQNKPPPQKPGVNYIVAKNEEEYVKLGQEEMNKAFKEGRKPNLDRILEPGSIIPGSNKKPPPPPVERAYKGKVEVLGSSNMPPNTMRRPAVPNTPIVKPKPKVIEKKDDGLCIGDCP